MRKLILIVGMFTIGLMSATVLVPSVTVGALDPLNNICSDNPDSEVCKSQNDDANALIGTIVNTLLFVIGALAVVMIIASGIMYTTSTGDSGRVTRAKNTLTYSIVGLLIAFLAYAIVNWVLQLF